MEGRSCSRSNQKRHADACFCEMAHNLRAVTFLRVYKHSLRVNKDLYRITGEHRHPRFFRATQGSLQVRYKNMLLKTEGKWSQYPNGDKSLQRMRYLQVREHRDRNTEEYWISQMYAVNDGAIKWKKDIRQQGTLEYGIRFLKRFLRRAHNAHHEFNVQPVTSKCYNGFQRGYTSGDRRPLSFWQTR